MQKCSLFNADLIKRYNKPGPRYTSYPTALQFNEQFTDDDYLACVKESNGYLIPLPISLYVHLPFCNTVCYYCACSKIITNNRQRALPYLDNLYREIEMQAKLFDPDRRVAQLHLGGGTPTFIGHENLRKLVSTLRQHFTFLDDENGEYSIEIDPREVNEQSIPLLGSLGFNRISIGVQDFDKKVQQAVNRIQSFEQTATVIESARDYNFRSVNVDLIYGLPLQTTETFQTTLEKILLLKPDRIALYNYAHLPQVFKTQKQINSEQLPGPEEKLSILHLSIKQLTEAGYVYIGMDHFALPQDDLTRALQNGSLRRNFQGYSTHSECDIVGLGITAIGQIGDCYTQNVKTLDEYDERIKKRALPVFKGIRLTEDDTIRRDVIMRLICNFKLDCNEIQDHYAIDFKQYFKKELKQLQGMIEDSLLSVENNRILVRPAGRLLIRNICMVFDKYLQTESQDRFSKAL